MLNRWIRTTTSTVERGGHRVGQIIKTLLRPVRTTAALTSAAALDAVRPRSELVAENACRSRIRCQAATGSWTRSRQWETQRTLFSSARATVCPPAKVNGVWPSNDAWLRAAL